MESIRQTHRPSIGLCKLLFGGRLDVDGPVGSPRRLAQANPIVSRHNRNGVADFMGALKHETECSSIKIHSLNFFIDIAFGPWVESAA
jgi:hypothetical protein